MKTKRLGYLGEMIARKYLLKKGYQILDKNYLFSLPGSPQKGEIDIIAKKGDTICFIEVKTVVPFSDRYSVNNFSPEEKVNFSKKRKIIRAAESWLIKNRVPLQSKWQIDVITVEWGDKKKISHFKNAVPYC